MFGETFLKTIGFIAAVFILCMIFFLKAPSVPTTSSVNSATKPTLSVGSPTSDKSQSVGAATASTTPPIKHITSTTVAKPIVVATEPAPTQVTPPPDFTAINTTARNSLVNIFCTSVISGSLDAVSGSGIIISPDGVILTNSHIAEYFLLKNFNGQQNFVNCVIRTGSPAVNTYSAEIVYLPLIWIQENADVIASSSPTGTGEHDYAFLKIIGDPNGNPLTGPFPYLPLDTGQDMRDGNNVLLAAYPASFLGGIALEKNLYQTTAIGQITDLITFASSTIDMISVPGTVVSQKGSSGGAVVNGGGQLIGIITTSSESDSTAGRDLRAITSSYINRDLQTQENVGINDLINNSDQFANDFQKNLEPWEIKILTSVLLGN